MGSAEKTAVFVVFIIVGLLMKLKLRAPEERAGIKKVILSLALPATIFIALLGIEVRSHLLLLPLVALALNGLLFFGVPNLLPICGIAPATPQFRTARLLVPSFAPGLSCFPFILEYLGHEALAQAAMADLGNKVFVLVVLYLLAMSWHHRRQANAHPTTKKMRSFAKALLAEPVNLFIVAALVLVSAGYSMNSLPGIVAEPLQRLSAMMTPLVLLFIGLAVRLNRRQFRIILSLLLMRAAVVAGVCAVASAVFGEQARQSVLVAVVFGLSACSFWPFAHISTVDGLEQATAPQHRTFDTGFAINVLALSFPLSTTLILGALSAGERLADPSTLFGAAMTLAVAGLAVAYLRSTTEPVAATSTTPKCAERTIG